MTTIDYLFHVCGSAFFEAVPIELDNFILQDHSPFFNHYYINELPMGYHVMIAFDGDVYGIVGSAINSDSEFEPILFPSLDRIFSVVRGLERKVDIIIPSDSLFIPSDTSRKS